MADEEALKIFAECYPVTYNACPYSHIYRCYDSRYLATYRGNFYISDNNYDLREQMLGYVRLRRLEEEITAYYVILAALSTAELIFLRKITKLEGSPVKINEVSGVVVEKMIAIRQLTPLPIGQAICDHLL